MRMPTFTAEAASYRSPNTYGGRVSAAAAGAIVVPAAPYCGNCSYVCSVCFRTGRVCGACGLCASGVCHWTRPDTDPPPEGAI
jgi:hypothetical protein